MLLCSCFAFCTTNACDWLKIRVKEIKNNFFLDRKASFRAGAGYIIPSSPGRFTCFLTGVVIGHQCNGPFQA